MNKKNKIMKFKGILKKVIFSKNRPVNIFNKIKKDRTLKTLSSIFLIYHFFNF